MAKAPKKRQRRVSTVKLGGAPAAAGHEDRFARLASAVDAVRAGGHASPRTAKLLGAGVPKMAQKLMEEAAETAIDAVRQERAGFMNESADLLYNLVVLWSELGVAPDEVWAEMDRREALLGMAEKLPRADDGAGWAAADASPPYNLFQDPPGGPNVTNCRPVQTRSAAATAR